MGNFRQITPFIHVPEIDAAIAFFEDILGFATLFRMEDYAYVHRETVGVRLLQNHGNDGAPPVQAAPAPPPQQQQQQAPWGQQRDTRGHDSYGQRPPKRRKGFLEELFD